MSNSVEDALALVMLGFPPGTTAEGDLRALVSRAELIGCKNLAEKLSEFKDAAASERLQSLCAELRFALLIAPLAIEPPTFHVGDNADVSFVTTDGTFLLEVVHKSAPHPISTVFYEEPSLLASYATASDWKGAAYRLNVVLRSLPVAVQPWLESGYLRNEIGGKKRRMQENACAALADWLAAELPMAVARGDDRLDYPDSDTHFEIERLEAAPGYMKGYGPRDAWFIEDGAFRQSIENKASKATSRLLTTGAHGYLIGLEIEDAFASRGNDILTTVLGPQFHRGDPGTNYSYRPITAATRLQVDDAERRGRADLLKLAHFDRRESNAHGHDAGLYFDSAFSDVTALLGLYYTGAVHFVPNPFSRQDIDPVRRLFPGSLTPISEGDFRSFVATRTSERSAV